MAEEVHVVKKKKSRYVLNRYAWRDLQLSR